ncbi:MAG: hypothetical protein ACD_66C00270G0006 [uncultured bacterium]|nr:MAG: hypothetical protein ACD_66C00270G0006 [uncultured bacterium]
MNADFDKKFPHLGQTEKELLCILTNEAQNKGEGFEKAKKVFLNVIKDWVLLYMKWDTFPDERIKLRRKLLNVAGLWTVVPFEDIQGLINEVTPYNKKPITDIKVDNLYQEGCEVPSYDLKMIDSMATLLGSVPKDETTTYLDFVAGNREKKVHPASSILVFKKSLLDEVVSEVYLTASAEVFSKTILITTFDEKGDMRDLISVAFDIVLESAYLDIYSNWSGNFVPEMVLRDTKLIACDFLGKAIANLENIQKNGKSLMDLYQIFPKGLPFMNYESWENIYLDLLKTRIYKKHMTEIDALNKKLGS